MPTPDQIFRMVLDLQKRVTALEARRVPDGYECSSCGSVYHHGTLCSTNKCGACGGSGAVTNWQGAPIDCPMCSKEKK